MSSGYFQCVAGHVTKVSGGNSRPFYYVKGLSGVSTKEGAIFVDDVIHSPSCNIATVDCLDGFKAIVGLGSKFEMVSINGTVLLGDQVTQSGNMLAKVAAWFSQARLTGQGKGRPIHVAEGKDGSMASALYVLSFNHSPHDAQNQIRFTIGCVMAVASPKA